MRQRRRQVRDRAPALARRSQHGCQQGDCCVPATCVSPEVDESFARRADGERMQQCDQFRVAAGHKFSNEGSGGDDSASASCFTSPLSSMTNRYIGLPGSPAADDAARRGAPHSPATPAGRRRTRTAARKRAERRSPRGDRSRCDRQSGVHHKPLQQLADAHDDPDRDRAGDTSRTASSQRWSRAPSRSSHRDKAPRPGYRSPPQWAELNSKPTTQSARQ